MRKDQIDAAAVNVERAHTEALADLVERHRRTLEVPPRTPAAERRVPRGPDALVLGVGFLPQGEVARVFLGILVARHSRSDFDLALIEARQAPIRRESREGEVNRPVLSLIS